LRFRARPRREQEHRHRRSVIVRVWLFEQAEMLAQQLERANLVPEPELHDRIGVPFLTTSIFDTAAAMSSVHSVMGFRLPLASTNRRGSLKPMRRFSSMTRVPLQHVPTRVGVDDAVRAVDGLDTIDHDACRRTFETRFDAARMARDYLEVYRELA